MKNRYDKEITRISDFYQTYSDLQGVTIRRMEENVLEITYNQSYEALSVHREENMTIYVIMNEKAVQKFQSEEYTWRYFTNKELKFFDQLGYSIDSALSRRLGQYIEDWFGKV